PGNRTTRCKTDFSDIYRLPNPESRASGSMQPRFSNPRDAHPIRLIAAETMICACIFANVDRNMTATLASEGQNVAEHGMAGLNLMAESRPVQRPQRLCWRLITRAPGDDGHEKTAPRHFVMPIKSAQANFSCPAKNHRTVGTARPFDG